jgi:uncharacterized repeat protein (TIGR01451 family)
MTIGLSYTAPSSGSVTVSSGIGTSTGQGPNVLPDTATGTTAVSPLADVTTSVSVPPTATAGSTVNGTVTYGNSGPSTASGMTYTLGLPSGLAGVSISGLPGGATAAYNSGTGTVTFTGMPTSLGAGSSVTIGVAYTAPASGSVTVSSGIGTSTSQGPNTLPDTATGTTTVSSLADLSITKTNGATSVTAGGTTTYTVTVTNSGPSSVTGATLTDGAATGLTKTAVACAATPGACVTPPTVAQLESGTFALPALSNGATYRITVTANVTATSGSVSNVATIAAPSGATDPTPGNNSATDTDTVISLFDPPSGQKVVNAAGLPELEWRMVWINSANTSAINVRITDPIPAGTTYVAGSVVCTPMGTSTTQTCTFDSVGSRVFWQGTIGPDAGATDEATAANEVVISFRVTVPSTVNHVSNQGSSLTDRNGDGSFADETTSASVSVSNAAVWDSGSGPPGYADIPGASPAGLALLGFLTAASGWFLLRRQGPGS